MTERKIGSKSGDIQAQNENRRLSGINWFSWRHNVFGHLTDRGLSLPEKSDEKILHDWFVLRREVQLGIKQGSDIDDFLKNPKIRELPDESAVIAGMSFITNRFRKDQK